MILFWIETAKEKRYNALCYFNQSNRQRQKRIAMWSRVDVSEFYLLYYHSTTITIATGFRPVPGSVSPSPEWASSSTHQCLDHGKPARPGRVHPASLSQLLWSATRGRPVKPRHLATPWHRQLTTTERRRLWFSSSISRSRVKLQLTGRQ